MFQKRTPLKILFLCFLFLMMILPIAAGGHLIFCEEEFVFAIFGDTRPERNLKIPETFLKIIDLLNDIEPDAVFHVGDIIYGLTSNQKRIEREYQDFLNVTSPLSAPLYISAGNHDIWDEHSSNVFEKRFGYLYRTIRLGTNSFILLNSEIPGQVCRIAGKQRQWLENELKKASKKGDHIFVLIHRPLFPVDGHIGKSMDAFPEDRDALHQLFKAFRVNAVISGHEHLYHSMEKDSIRYIISGGGGKQLYASEKKGGFHHFLLLKIQDKKIDFSVIKLEKKSGIFPFIKSWRK